MDEENEVIDDINQTANEGEEKKEIVWENIWAPDSEFTPLKNPPSKEASEYIPSNLSFLEKLQIWTQNFTSEPLDINILKATGMRATPEFSDIEEFNKYQRIKSIYLDYSSRFNKDASEIWKMVKQEHPELFTAEIKQREDDGEER